MRKYGCLFVGIMVLILVPFAAFGGDSVKIAVVDLNRCMKESLEGKRVYRELQKKKDAMQKRLDEKEGELLKLQEELKKQGMMLSLDARADKEKTLERKRREFKYYFEDLRDEMRKVEADLVEGMLQDLGKIVGDMAEKGNYTLVLEKNRGGILFNDLAIDITDDVIKAYDRTKK